MDKKAMYTLICLFAVPAAAAGAAAAASVAEAPTAAAGVNIATTNSSARAARVLQGAQLAAALQCHAERQVVMCNHLDDAQHRASCCELHAPAAPMSNHSLANNTGRRLAAAAAPLDALKEAQAQVLAMAGKITRRDLPPPDDAGAPPRRHKLFEHIPAECMVPVELPDIPPSRTMGPAGTWQQYVPRLTSTTIRQVRAAAFSSLPAPLRKQVRRLEWISPQSGFVHPAGIPGPTELVWMQERLQQRQQPQEVARHALLTGAGVRPKLYTHAATGTHWAPPTDCPLNVKGPYALPEVTIDWGGLDAKGPAAVCSEAFEAEEGAPRKMCGHISAVELDAVMAYKQALAWYATGDDRHARNAVGIVAAWTGNRTTWGVRHRNGPLEAAWMVSSMARALELLRTQAPDELVADFLHWVDHELMPQMDYFVDDHPLGMLHSNFHSAIADAMTAVAVLGDDRARWAKARAVHQATLERYLRWGRGIWAPGHVLGECTETQRDLFHSQMGLAGLLQAAESAFQQGEDWFSGNDHALAAAVELHARFVRAAMDGNEDALPAGFAFFESMPKPPRGHYHRYDWERMTWVVHNTRTGKQVRDRPFDGNKYLLGTDWLPAGYELAYNHYVGRLGMHMPETAALLRRVHLPEWYELYFGAGTLTHSDSASDLWVPGIRAGFKVCTSS